MNANQTQLYALKGMISELPKDKQERINGLISEFREKSKAENSEEFKIALLISSL